MPGNNPPHAVVEMDKELYDFVMKSVEANMRMGLSVIMSMSPEGQREMVSLLEQNKRLKAALEKGKL